MPNHTGPIPSDHPILHDFVLDVLPTVYEEDRGAPRGLARRMVNGHYYGARNNKKLRTGDLPGPYPGDLPGPFREPSGNVAGTYREPTGNLPGSYPGMYQQPMPGNLTRGPTGN